MNHQLYISIGFLLTIGTVCLLGCGSSTRETFVCGNAVAEENVERAVASAKVLASENRLSEAVHVLLPEISYNGLADNSEVIHLVVAFLHRLLPQEQLRDSLQQSTLSIYSEDAEDIERVKYFYTRFLGTKIRLYHEREFLAIQDSTYRHQIQTIPEYRESFRRSEFYQSIMNSTTQ